MITDEQKKLFLEQLKKTPIIQVVCEKTGICRSTYYRLRKDDEDFRKSSDEAVNEGSFLVNDLAESQLINAIKDRNLGAISLWLKTHHPNYAARIELGGKLTVENAPFNDEQWKLIKKALALMGITEQEAYDDAKPAI